MSENKCPNCGKSYGSTTHQKRCRGLSGPALRQWRYKRNGSHGYGASGAGRGWTASSVLRGGPAINTDALPRMAAEAPAGVDLQAVRS